MGTGENAGRVGFGLTLLGALATVALLMPVPAPAYYKHLLQETFGSAAQPTFAKPTAIAVDPASGDVLVADIKTQTIQRFKPNGEPDPFSVLGTNTIDAKGSGSGPGKTGVHPCAAPIATECDETPQNGLFLIEAQIAIAPPGSVAGTAGDIYVSQPSKRVVSVFSSGGEYLGQLNKAGTVKFSEPVGVAVDSAGTLFVGHYEASFNDANRRVYRYVPTANPPLVTDLTGAFALPEEVQPTLIAIGTGSSAGYLFAQGGFTETYKLDSATGEVKCKVASGPPAASLAVSSSGDSLFVGPSTEIFEYKASGPGCDEAPLSRTPPSSTGAGGFASLAVGAGGQIYAGRRSDPSATPLEVYGSAVAVFPDVKANPATGVAPTTATLNGEVTHYGVEISECVFEYGLEPKNLNQSAPCEGSIPVDGEPHPVSASIAGLKPATSYYFRLKATNADGHTETSESRGLNTLAPVLNTLSVTVSGQGEVSADSGAISACTETSGTCEGSYEEGAKVTLSENPVPGYEFAGWSGCEAEPEGKCMVTISADLEIGASFKEEEVIEEPGIPLAVSLEGTGTGTVSSDVGLISCNPFCEDEYEEGTKVTLTATATPGSIFYSWRYCDTGGVNGRQCTVTVDKAKTVKATFITIHALAVSKAPGSGLGKVQSPRVGSSASSTAPTPPPPSGRAPRSPSNRPRQSTSTSSNGSVTARARVPAR